VTAPTAHQGAAGNLSKVPEGGRGLLGLRERVLVYGGELDAGHRPGGGWLVRALIPQEQAPSAPTTSCSAAL
jgi:glucose-6-phosphate-specific signal transduction histidine kinase